MICEICRKELTRENPGIILNAGPSGFSSDRELPNYEKAQPTIFHDSCKEKGHALEIKRTQERLKRMGVLKDDWNNMPSRNDMHD